MRQSLHRWAAIVLVMSFTMAARADTALRVAVEALPLSQGNPFRTSLSPTIYALAAVFDGLTQFDPNGQLKPALAESWESIDALTWRFHLRPGVTFSNGAPLTSDAFVSAINYLGSDEAAKDGVKTELAVLKSARRIDELTFDIVTSEPVASFPRYATAIMAAEPEQWRKLGREGFAKAPIGTGPFKVESLAESRWRLAAYKDSWRKPKVDRLELLMLPDAASRVQALASRRVDIALSIGPDNIDPLEAAGARVKSFISATTFAITFMTTRPGPLADVRVRKALNLAVNRERIVNGLLAGRTAASGQPATRIVFGFDPDLKPFPYDPAQAKKLLAEAGYANGFPFTLDAAVSATASDSLVFQQVQSDLRAVGVTMNINTMPYPVFLNKTVRTEFENDAFPIHWTSWPTMDALRPMRAHSCERLVPWYCDQEIMPALMSALAVKDDVQALAIRRQLSRYFFDHATGMILYEMPIFVGLAPRVAQFDMIGYRIFYDRIALAD